MQRSVLSAVAVFLYFSFIILCAAIGGYFVITINIHSFSWLLAVIVNLVLAWVVFSRGKDNIVNRVFAVCTVFFALWAMDVFFLHIIRDEIAVRYWTRLLRPSLFFTAPTFFHFVQAITGNIKKNNRFIVISYVIAVLFSLLNFAGYFDEIVKRDVSFFPRLTPLYLFSLINLAFWSVFGLVTVFEAYSSASSRARKQFKYIFVASAVAIIFSFIPNTLYGLGINVYPLGGLALVAYVGILSYAIVRYNLMDIDVVIRKSIIYALVTLALVSVYAFVVGISQVMLEIMGITNKGWLSGGFASVIIAALFLPLRNRTQYAVDRLFYKEKYNYQKTLKELSNDLVSIIELDVLLDLLLRRIVDVMHIAKGYIMLYNQEKDVFEVKTIAGDFEKWIEYFELGKTSDVVLRMQEHQAAMGVDDHFEELSQQGIVLVIPLMRKQVIVGLLNFGNKLSEDLFTDEDKELLSTLANQAAIAIENAELSARMRVLEKDLFHADKLSALGTFAASIAHEIKNPLASVKTFSQLLARKADDRKFVERFNATVPGEIERMERVLSQMLDFSRFSEVVRAPVNIEHVIDSLLELLHYEAFKNGVKIIREYAGNIPPIAGSDEQLKQVFMNLALNAIQAMPGGGKLIITTRVSAGSIIISFRDTGAGIPDEVKERLFKPFFTTKRTGTGLGLSITKRIIKEHGGAIEVESNPGEGTIFIIRFPLSGQIQ